MPNHLDSMAVFVAVVEAKHFCAAGDRLGVSGSAVSQTLRRLEEQLGVALVQRTTRSFRLTSAGEALYAAARPALDQLQAAITAASELGVTPCGVIRLVASSGADQFLRGSLLADFLAAHPRARLDLAVCDEEIDIVESGYDVGIQLGEVIDRDMIAVPITGAISLAIVGAPSYFSRRGMPDHPRELTDHTCINWRPAPEAPPYRWEFTENGRNYSLTVDSRIVSNDGALNLRLACAGIGLTVTHDDLVRDYIERGELVRVLEAFCPAFPGYYLYYPQRCRVSPVARAFIDYLRTRGGQREERHPLRRLGISA